MLSQLLGLQDEGSYKLCKVKRAEFGKGAVPHITVHDGRTIRYPDPDIKVCIPNSTWGIREMQYKPDAKRNCMT